MRLYGVPRSPFAARVQAAIALKGLEIPMVPPPAEGLKSAEFLALNPMGRIPVLVLDSGETLPESEVITEYLEQLAPERPLLPAEPLARANVRLIARIAELYVMGPILGLFGCLAPDRRDSPETDRLFDQLQAGLGHLDGYLGVTAYAAGEEPTLADCALVPILFWAEEIARMFGRPSLVAAAPDIALYAASMAAEPLFGPLATAMADDLAALRGLRQS